MVRQGALKFCHRFPPAFKIAFGVGIDSDPNRVPALVRSDVWVNTLFVAKTGLSLTQDLEVDPTQPDLFKLALNVPPQKIITRQIRAALGRKH